MQLTCGLFSSPARQTALFRRSTLVFALLLATSIQLAASSALTLHGRILDASRAPIAQARLTVSPGNLSVTTSPTGEFALPLPVGSYSLTVAAPGFLPHSQALSNLTAPLEIILAIAPQSTAVTITETAPYQELATSTATKTLTPLAEIPQSISIVNRTLIQDQLMLSMADVVRYVPGITMAQGEGHRDAPVIRGNASTSDFFVDGIRDDVQYFRDLYNLERVEAVKGPNAMIFGRGGGGGVINRVTKQAGFARFGELTLQGGQFGHKRGNLDLNHALTSKLAVRLNTLFEDTNSFRQFGNLQRYGIAPTLTYAATENTRLRLAYEHFDDRRLVDRGIPSFNGRPSAAHRATYFGNPNESPAHAGVHLGSVTLDHQKGRLSVRNNTLLGAYDKFYGNVFPGALNATGTLASLSGYDTDTHRQNLFNQTDVTYQTARQTLLAGAEFGRQSTENRRQTAFFNNTATTLYVPFTNPLDATPVVWRQNATDALNRAVNTVAATYLQNQLHLTRRLQLIGGLRFDRFDLTVRNRRTLTDHRRIDHLLSPRAGLLFKPVAPLSLYVNYSVSYLPSAGDQFASLDATTETLKPEKFTNYEVGAKFDLARSLSLTAALYRLDRTNTRTIDPNNPARILQTGSQRSNGFEFALNGNLTRRWTVAGGYAYQVAEITSATATARLGAQVPLVPRHSVSLWNNLRLTNRLSGGLGLIQQGALWAGIDNTVRLPSFVRADAALYYSLTERLRLQANVENLTNNSYFPTAHNNNNITPGAPRTLRLALTVRF